MDRRPAQGFHALEEKSERERASRNLVRNRTLSFLDPEPLQQNGQLLIANLSTHELGPKQTLCLTVPVNH